MIFQFLTSIISTGNINMLRVHSMAFLPLMKRFGRKCIRQHPDPLSTQCRQI